MGISEAISSGNQSLINTRAIATAKLMCRLVRYTTTVFLKNDCLMNWASNSLLIQKFPSKQVIFFEIFGTASSIIDINPNQWQFVTALAILQKWKKAWAETLMRLDQTTMIFLEKPSWRITWWQSRKRWIWIFFSETQHWIVHWNYVRNSWVVVL